MKMTDRRSAIDKFYSLWKQFEAAQAKIKTSEPKLIQAMMAAERHMECTFRLIADTYYPEEATGD